MKVVVKVLSYDGDEMGSPAQEDTMSSTPYLPCLAQLGKIKVDLSQVLKVSVSEDIRTLLCEV
jgi:hypothetical protein